MRIPKELIPLITFILTVVYISLTFVNIKKINSNSTTDSNDFNQCITISYIGSAMLIFCAMQFEFLMYQATHITKEYKLLMSIIPAFMIIMGIVIIAMAVQAKKEKDNPNKMDFSSDAKKLMNVNIVGCVAFFLFAIQLIPVAKLNYDNFQKNKVTEVNTVKSEYKPPKFRSMNDNPIDPYSPNTANTTLTRITLDRKNRHRHRSNKRSFENQFRAVNVRPPSYPQPPLPPPPVPQHSPQPSAPSPVSSIFSNVSHSPMFQ